MIEDRVIQITERGVSRMDFGMQWKIEAYKRGLRDPWEHRPNRPIRTEEVLAKIAGTEIPATKTIYNEPSYEEISAWKAERDEYIRQRDEWIALQMFNKYGYEQFCLECEFNNLSDDFWRSVRPCESAGQPQCNLFCALYEDCEWRKNYENREC
jgi:hypothetical protein